HQHEWRAGDEGPAVGVQHADIFGDGARARRAHQLAQLGLGGHGMLERVHESSSAGRRPLRSVIRRHALCTSSGAVAIRRTPMIERDFEAGWRPRPGWSAIWVGALPALAVGLVIGLIGYAVGAHQLAGPRTMTFKNIRMVTMIFNVAGGVFALPAACGGAPRPLRRGAR